MVVTRIAVLCGLSVALGGCLTPTDSTGSLPAPSQSAVATADLPPNAEPGQPLNSGLGRTGSGVNPSANLASSERARASWKAQQPYELALPSWRLAEPTGSIKAAQASDPASTASVLARGKNSDQRGAGAQPYDAEATMENLEKDGRRVANPICNGC